MFRRSLRRELVRQWNKVDPLLIETLRIALITFIHSLLGLPPITLTVLTIAVIEGSVKGALWFVRVKSLVVVYSLLHATCIRYGEMCT